MKSLEKYGPFVLRLGIGGLFLAVGLMKLMDPSMPTGMLEKLGFPLPMFWAWVLILSEVLGGAALLAGFKLKYATVPLAIILLVAAVTNPMGSQMGPMKDVVLMLGAISLWFSGPGAWAIDKK